jgi:hypothetical protein
MQQQKSFQSSFKWIPLHLRNGGFPPRKPDMRMPIFWLTRSENELFFVNDSDETLDLVTTESGGFQTCDDAVMGISSDEGYRYSDVKAHGAVKVEEYDDFYDADFILQVSIFVQSKTKGNFLMRTLPQKGGVVELVLLWDTDETGKNVYLEKE